MRRDDFIPPAPTDEAEFFRGATVVLDTNVLLALYKLSVSAREDALRAIESSVDRLWLPHQVGVEFYRHHAAHRDMRSKAYRDAIKQTAQFERLATKDLGSGTTHEDLRKNVARVVRDAVRQVDVEIEKARDADTAITTPESDDVLERIETAFDGRVAAVPAPATLRSRTEEFTNWRVPGRVPPGFEDRGKTGTVRTAGDYLIWAEILEHAAANHLDILFVTEDGKDDWWENSEGGRRPHRDLVLEFQRATGSNYHQVGMEAFVRLATSATGDVADQNTLNEIVAVGEEAQERASRGEGVLEHLLKLGVNGDSQVVWPLWHIARDRFTPHVLYYPDVDFPDDGPGPEMTEEARRRYLRALERRRELPTGDEGHHDDPAAGIDDDDLDA